MRLRLLILAVALCGALTARPAHAQDATADNAVLIADTVELTDRNTLVADGNVEALFGKTRLKARKLTYDRAADLLTFDGPVTLMDGDSVVVLADAGQMDGQLRNGLMRGARMVMDRQVQMAAPRIDRVGGRYTQLYKVAATSCRVCETDRAPIWQIRAKRAIHDQEEKQIYFDQAQLRVLDVPVLWLPRLRLPDPTLKRARGFLIPELKQSTRLGLGVKIPYFIPWGDHRDITVTPYLSAETRTLEWRYRQMFRRGEITFNGAVSDDTLSNDLRAYVFGNGTFRLDNHFVLSFGLGLASDRAYLYDYQYSGLDRLANQLALTRTRRDSNFRATLTGYQTLREAEDNYIIPAVIGDVDYEQRLHPKWALGGEIRLGTGAHAHQRGSDLDVVGRDVTRGYAQAQFLRGWTGPGGLLAQVDTGVAIDGFTVHQDSTTPDSDLVVTPHAAVTLRWPLMRHEAGDAFQTLEPMAMIGWTGGSGPDVPNEESRFVEFDEANLLSLTRFPARDRRERGLAMAYGVNWTRSDPDGWTTALTLGQALKDEADPDFTRSSGLRGTDSDILLAFGLRHAKGFSLQGRTLLDHDLGVTKAEARLSLNRAKYGLAASYVWLDQDADENRPETVSEWALSAGYNLSRHWTATTNWRYDVATDRTAEAGLGVIYRNECVDLSLSLSRQFASSAILTPNTYFGFTVGLRGFATRTNDKSYTRTCRN